MIKETWHIKEICENPQTYAITDDSGAIFGCLTNKGQAETICLKHNETVSLLKFLSDNFLAG